jgi:hypothetical protein
MFQASALLTDRQESNPLPSGGMNEFRCKIGALLAYDLRDDRAGRDSAD